MTPPCIEDIYPLTGMQRGLLLYALSARESDVYARQMSWIFNQMPEAERYAQAWRKLFARHAALRTSFVWQGIGDPLQVVHRAVEPAVSVVALSAGDCPGWQAELEARAALERQRPFQLDRAPLLRVTLMPSPDGQCGCILTFHHIILDGWSLFELLSEAESLAAGTPYSALRQRPRFGAFVAAQHAGSREQGDRFWKDALAGFSGSALPWGLRQSPAPRQRTAVMRSLVRRLEGKVATALRLYARSMHVTISTLVHVAWAFVLGRHTNQSDVLFGTTISGRACEFADVDALIGVLTQTIPIRLTSVPGEAIATTVRRVQRFMESAMAAAQTPLTAMSKWAQIPPGGPLFETLVIVENYPVAESIEKALREDVTHVQADTATHYPVTLTAWLHDAPVLTLDADPSLCDASECFGMLEHVAAVLEAIAAEPDGRVTDLPGVPPSQLELVRSVWASGPAPFGSQPVEECVRAHARAYPNDLAIRAGGTQLTYDQLDRRIDGTATALIGLGVRPETLVALALERSPELIVAVLAVMRAGAAWLPLDLRMPSARQVLVLRDARPALLVVDSRIPDVLQADSNVPRFYVDRLGEHSDRNCPLPTPDPRVAAYVIYTSGSTGTPKGVVIPREALCNYLHFAARAYQLKRGAGVPLHSSPAVDLTITSLLVPFVIGAFVDVMDDLLALEFSSGESPHGLLKLTPTHLQAFAQWEPAASLVRRCETLVVGGEVLTSEMVRPWLSPQVQVINEYGPTEATVGCSIFSVRAEEMNAAGALPIGRPVAGARIHVLNDEMALVPVGVPGELYVGGVCLARGYLGDAALTASCFVADPFSTAPGQRLYRTGDIVRWRIDGQLELLGRCDSQLKIRGTRIEPTEIETSLRRQDGIRDAAVVLYGRESPQLVAFVVSESEFDALALRRQLATELPDAAIPAQYVRIEALPRSLGGKLDRRALTEQIIPPTSTHSPPEPLDPMERVLAELWARVLGSVALDRDTDFFSLGGDSILALQLVVKAREAGLSLTPRQIAEHPTIRSQARVAKRLIPVTIEQPELREPFSLTPIQHWLFGLGSPEPWHWNQTLLLSARRPVNPAVLQAALRTLCERHAALRLRFNRVDGEWRQRSSPDSHVPLDFVDIEGPQQIDAASKRFQRSLNLADGPIFRAICLSTPSCQYLLLIAHHLAVDGVSWRILREDLENLLSAQPSALALPQITSTFAQWSAGLQLLSRSSLAQRERAFWLRRAPQSTLRPWRELTAGEGVDTEELSSSLEVSLTGSQTEWLLQVISHGWGWRLEELLLAAAARAIARIARLERLCIDVEHHGRDAPEPLPDVSRTVGWFTSIYPVTLSCAKRSALELAQDLRNDMRSVACGGVMFGVLRYLARDRLPMPSRATLRFNYFGRITEGEEDRLFDIVAMPLRHARSQRAPRPHPLELDCVLMFGTLRMFWGHGLDSHSPATVAQLGRYTIDELLGLAQSIVEGAAPEPCSADFPVTNLDPAALAQMLDSLADDIDPVRP